MSADNKHNAGRCHKAAVPPGEAKGLAACGAPAAKGLAACGAPAAALEDAALEDVSPVLKCYVWRFENEKLELYHLKNIYLAGGIFKNDLRILNISLPGDSSSLTRRLIS